MFKKISSLVLSIAIVLGLAACTDLGNEVSAYYVNVDINPSIEFLVDGEDNVESYLFLNEDAEILCADLDFTGMNVDDAVELFILTATEAGYIDPDGDDNAILITVIGEDDEQPRIKRIRERIRTRAIKHLAQRYINGTVLGEDFTQEDLVAEAELLGVSPGKLKLSYAAMAVDETLILDELLEMPVKDIMSIVKELHADEWSQYKDDRLQHVMKQKREMLQEHKADIDAIIADNPELTEEEIDVLIEQYKADARAEAKENWHDRVNQWKQNRQQRKADEETQDTDTGNQDS